MSARTYFRSKSKSRSKNKSKNKSKSRVKNEEDRNKKCLVRQRGMDEMHTQHI